MKFLWIVANGPKGDKIEATSIIDETFVGFGEGLAILYILMDFISRHIVDEFFIHCYQKIRST